MHLETKNLCGSLDCAGHFVAVVWGQIQIVLVVLFSRSVMSSDPMDCSMPGFPVRHQLPELAQNHVRWVSVAIQPSHPLSFPSPAFSLSQRLSSQSIGTSASASILPMNTQGLFPFRIDWFDLLAVQGTLKSLLQHHNSKASVLWHSAFSIVQLSHPHMATGKSIALTRRTFVGEVMSLLFNMLCWWSNVSAF